MSIIGSGWGQYANAKNKLNNYDGEWGGETAVGEMFQTTQASIFYIYLRGELIIFILVTMQIQK